jgi:acetyl-CoA C-acetyltransferase
MAEAYIVATARTAGGRKGGRLAGWHPADLAASVLDSLIDRTGADPAQIEDVIMGCVMQAGEQSNNIGRNAVMASKLPESVPATSIDRQCGSSQQALHFAAQAVMSGTMDCVIAAGVESMTRVPMGLASSLPAKNGFGHYKSPGLEKLYPNIVFSQFTGAESGEARALKDDLDACSTTAISAPCRDASRPLRTRIARLPVTHGRPDRPTPTRRRGHP